MRLKRAPQFWIRLQESAMDLHNNLPFLRTHETHAGFLSALANTPQTLVLWVQKHVVSSAIPSSCLSAKAWRQEKKKTTFHGTERFTWLQQVMHVQQIQTKHLLRTCHMPDRGLSAFDIGYLIYSHNRPISLGLLILLHKREMGWGRLSNSSVTCLPTQLVSSKATW